GTHVDRSPTPLRSHRRRRRCRTPRTRCPRRAKTAHGTSAARQSRCRERVACRRCDRESGIRSAFVIRAQRRSSRRSRGSMLADDRRRRTGGAQSMEDRIDLVDGAFWGRNPHEEFTWLRKNAPVWRDPKHGVWGVATYDLVKYVSSQPKLFSSAEGIRPDS